MDILLAEFDEAKEDPSKPLGLDLENHDQFTTELIHAMAKDTVFRGEKGIHVQFGHIMSPSVLAICDTPQKFLFAIFTMGLMKGIYKHDQEECLGGFAGAVHEIEGKTDFYELCKEAYLNIRMSNMGRASLLEALMTAIGSSEEEE